MRFKFADTLFARLFALAVGTIVVSHVIAFGLMYMLYRDASRCQPQPPVGGVLIAIATELLALATVAWLGARSIARPIQQLAVAAVELGNDVNRSALPESGPVEAQMAARAFNRMQAALRQQLANRDRFLAAVSHDLRTPLTRIRLRVEQLSEAKVRAKLHDDAAEMAAMLDATLDYLRGEAASEASAMLDVQALVGSMVDDYEEQGHAIGCSGAVAPILAQPIALRRALANLMENALRYGGQAQVECAEGPAGLAIRIHDQGPGIPAAELSAVMQPFYRLESSRNKASGGAGLGLSIAREAIERQGGTLTLQNAPGGGLLATVLLRPGLA
jgi:signal transduction histidine kinase